MSFVEPLTRRATVRRFVVEQLRVARRTAAFGQRAHRHEPFVGADADSQFIADPQLLRGLCARPVHVHLAAGDSRGRERAGFEESRRPEPAIESYGCRLSVGR